MAAAYRLWEERPRYEATSLIISGRWFPTLILIRQASTDGYPGGSAMSVCGLAERAASWARDKGHHSTYRRSRLHPPGQGDRSDHQTPRAWGQGKHYSPIGAGS